MKNSRLMVFAFGFFLSVLLGQVPAGSQNKSVSQKKASSYSTALQKNGWTLPNLSEFKVRDSEQTEIEKIPVDLKHFVPVKRIDTVFQLFSLADEGLRIVDLPVRILGISQFTAKKGTFGYVVKYGLLDKRSDGSVALKGAMISVAYIDDDGDGLFETRKLNIDSLSLVPGWISGN